MTIDHYDVAGTTPAEIRATMDRDGPLDPHDGTRNHAIVSWRIEWRYGDDAGGCDLATTRTIFRARVLMPQLVSPDVPPHVRAEWDRYSTALLAHEAGHVRNAFRRRADVRAAVAGATCGTANAAGDAVIADVVEDDHRYDARTRHGIEEGVVYPQP